MVRPRRSSPFDCAAGVVRSEGEEEGSLDAELVEEGKEVRHADARAPVGVDVDPDGEEKVGHSVTLMCLEQDLRHPYTIRVPKK